MSLEIIFTTLPNGRTEQQGKPYLKLSVFVSLQIKTPGNSTLGKFEDVMNWPDKLANTQFKFRTGNNIMVDALPDSHPDSDLYKSIFHKDIKVKGYLPENFSNIRINSYQAINIRDFVIKNYLNTAVDSPTRLVTADAFIDDNRFGVISQFTINQQEFEQVNNPQRKAPVNMSNLMIRRTVSSEQVKSNLRTLRYTTTLKKANPSLDFAQFRNFHRLDETISRKAKIVRPEKPEFEFHDILSVLNSYPQMMRKTGFILDFVIPFDNNIPQTGGINLVPSSIDFTDQDTVISVPQTAYKVTSDGFLTDDQNNSLFRQGFVKINTDEFAVVEVDADGTAIKTANLADNKTQQVARYLLKKSDRMMIHLDTGSAETEPASPPVEEGLPSIRTSGIAITKTGMAEHVLNRINSNLNLRKVLIDESPVNKTLVPGLRLRLPDTKLYSSDLVQGYRMDIAYDTDPDTWYSLHQRKDNYTWYDESANPHPVENIVPDEGFIELGVAEDPDDPSSVFVSDTIARWEGWSLSVGKPGFAINNADDPGAPPPDSHGVRRDFVYKSKSQEIKKYAFDPDLHFRINAQSDIIPGTLPKLRFGRGYQIRIRTVDLAGNSLSLQTKTPDPDLTVRKNIRYLRYEPLASPIVLVGNGLKDGEFLERMVIRSNYDQDPDQYEKNRGKNGNTFEPFSQRFLLPPKNSQAMAETHGMFEKAFSGNADAAKEIYQIIAAHEGTYSRDSSTVEKVYQPSEVEVIYLPDPMAAGVAFFVAEGYETTHTQDFFTPRLFGFFEKDEVKPDKTNVDIPDDWYKARPIRIRLEEGDLAANWNASDRVFTVSLPKGLQTRIKFSTFWREKDFKELSALWDLIRSQSPSNLKQLEQLVKTGQHWMISPSREFELVHALQQPLLEPELKALIPARDFDDTTADINARFTVHGESTEKTEIQAKWTEPLDDGISVSIKSQEGRNSIPDITIHYLDDVITRGTIPEITKAELAKNPKLVFQPHPGLKVRNFTEFKQNPQPDATRIVKYYQAQSSGFEKLQGSSLASSKLVADRLKFDIEASRYSLYRNINFRLLPLKQSFGDTKHRWVDYKVVATTRYRECFAKDLEIDPSLALTRDSQWVEKVNILSTVRPKAPEIDYIIPTFEWVKTQHDNVIRHLRRGGGLRVYIKRPWYSSGPDELLGIILPPSSESKTGRVMETTGMMKLKPGYTPYYTHWGLDPLHTSTQPDVLSPNTSDFRLNPVFENNLQYPGQANIRALVAGYPVQFDEELQMWYADLAINPGNLYFPFIRLMLVRYQPHSVRKGTDDVCLSPVVITDMMQLMPDRTTTLTFKSDEKNSKFTLTIEGVIYNGLSRGSRLTDTVIRISFLDTHTAQPFLGVIDDGSTPKKLTDEAYEIPISAKEISNNRFTISRDFVLPREYKEAPFEIVIREFEQIPEKTRDIPKEYENRVSRSPDTEKLVYADVFKINSTK